MKVRTAIADVVTPSAEACQQEMKKKGRPADFLTDVFYT